VPPPAMTTRLMTWPSMMVSRVLWLRYPRALSLALSITQRNACGEGEFDGIEDVLRRIYCLPEGEGAR